MKKLNSICSVLAVACILTVLTGCSKKSGKESNVYGFIGESKVSSPQLAMKTAALADYAVSNDFEYEMAEESAAFYENGTVFLDNGTAFLDNGTAVPEPVEGAQENFERKLIRTGNVSLEVQTVSGAEEEITAWAKSLGGYVTNANTWQGGAGFTVRIPSARFDEAMAQVGNFGRITNRSVSSDDVSDNYYDLKSRLETKYILRDKLTGYLSQAKDIKDLLEIERQLNSVIEDIESTESRFKRLSSQVDYSTIYINMQFERGKDEGGIILPDVKNSWNDFVSNIIAFFWGLLKILFYIVIFGIPIVAVAAFFFWLLFGKVGLLVKLFKKLKK